MTDTRAFPLPSISEDTLHYTLHLRTSDAEAQATLITAHVESQLPQPWLWNKDPWELKVEDGELAGTMRVGDAVDDEWLVVWLLRGVSEKWRDAVIRWVGILFCSVRSLTAVSATRTASSCSLKRRIPSPLGSRLRMPRIG